MIFSAVATALRSAIGHCRLAAMFLLSCMSLWHGPALAQEIDMISQKLGLASPQAPMKKLEGEAAVDLRVRLSMRAGQSYLLKDGISALPQATNDSDMLQYEVTQSPSCGSYNLTKNGPLFSAPVDCIGKTVTFGYVVAWRQQSDRKARVAVEMIVNRGLETCGVANFPFEMVRIPGGVYSLKKPPSTIMDIVQLSESTEIKVPNFCISEDLVPVGELEAFLARMPASEQLQLFPEMEQPLGRQSISLETGKGSTIPATGASHRVAMAVAEELSARFSRKFELPSFDHYVAAALYFQKQKSVAKGDAGDSFLVSLRSGLFEWTRQTCGAAGDNFGALGLREPTGEVVKYCYAPQRRLQQLGFRIIAIE